jgi:outer membrane lipoprotein LolB
MSRSSLARLLAATGMAALLGACATPAPPVAEPPAPETRYAGRFSASWRGPADADTPQRASGSFSLRVAAAGSELTIATPLGQTVAVATLDAQGARLVTADGQQLSAPDAGQLTERAFGWPAPIGELSRWMAGPQGAPAAPAAARAGPGSDPVSFTDAGWRVSIEAWRDGWPQRLVLRWPEGSGAAPLAGRVSQVELRLLVDSAERRGGSRP